MCGKKYDWKQPNRLLVLQTGDSVEQAKVFKAQAVLQGLCANLINVLKLLAKSARRWRWSLTEYSEGRLTMSAPVMLDRNAGALVFSSTKAESARGLLGCDSQGEPGSVDIKG